MFSFSSLVFLAVAVSAIPAPAPQSGSKSFTLQNGKDAIALNDKFKSLSADSSCTTGDQACVNDQFAQCVGGKFTLTACAGGTICAALPLVNKAGTSITCTTATDRDARIAATGATGSSSGSSPPAPAAPTSAFGNVAAAGSSSGDFKAQNGKDAQALNQKFASLTADSACTAGEDACVNDQFAQCVNGKFALTSCGGDDLICAALPLVNSKGTSVTCTTAADRDARIATALGSSSSGSAAPASGSGSGAASSPAAAAPAPSKAAPSGSSSGSFKAQNGKDAQALNQKFASLTADSSCTAGENACVNNQFAQCVNGKFALTSCGGGDLICAALPLVNSKGTSVTCTTAADRDARIQTALSS